MHYSDFFKKVKGLKKESRSKEFEYGIPPPPELDADERRQE